MIKNKGVLLGYIITKKYYSKDDNLFHVIKNNADLGCFADKIESTYKTFDEFYLAVKKNLNGANLIEYDFRDCNPKDYNLKNALLSSRTMIKIGTYDAAFYEAFCKDLPLAKFTPSNSLELIAPRRLSQDDLENDNDFLIFYISDF